MADAPAKLSDQIRAAVDASGRSRYAICKELGLSQATMSRFMSSKSGISIGVLDRLGELLGLAVVTDPDRANGRKDARAGQRQARRRPA